MRQVRVEKEELHAAVTKNRAAHQGIFEEAVEGYKAEAVRQLEAHIARIKTGALVQVAVQLPMPVNHIHDYDRVLRMLEMSVEDEIEIDPEDFAAYVMDDWHWKRQFIGTNAAYSATASASL